MMQESGHMPGKHGLRHVLTHLLFLGNPEVIMASVDVKNSLLVIGRKKKTKQLMCKVSGAYGGQLGTLEKTLRTSDQ